MASVLYFRRVVDSPANFQFDDAFMFLRYAKHFLAGRGFSWNVDDGPVYGATSALHLVFVTALRRMTSIPDDQVLILASFVPSMLAVGVLVCLGFLVLGDGVLRRAWVPLAIVPALLLSPWFQFHSRTGMETMLSLLCNAIVIVCTVAFARRRSTTNLALCVVAAYASYLARPDNALVCLLCPPLFFIASDRRLRMAAGVYAMSLLVVLVGDLFLKARVFGDAIPLSLFAKRAGFYADYLGGWRWNSARYMLIFAAECAPWLALLVAAADRRAIPRLAALLGPVALTSTLFFAVVQIMGFGARFYFPFLPFVIGAALVAVDSCADGRSWLAMGRSTWGRRAALIAVTVVMSLEYPRDLATRGWQRYVIGSPTASAPERTYVTHAPSPLPSVRGFEITRNVTAFLQDVPSGTSVATSEHGYLGSLLPDVAVVDLVGLHDRVVARNGFSADYLFSRHPDVIWFPPRDYSRLITDILDSATFPRRYVYFPGAFEHGLAIDTTSPRFADIKRSVERTFARVYEGRRLDDYEGFSAETQVRASDPGSAARESRGERR